MGQTMLTQGDARVVAAVEAVAACVESRYVDAGGRARAAEALRTRLRSGGYSAVTYEPALAPVLTADLQAALPDLHLQTRWSEEVREASTVSDWDDPEYLAHYWAREALSNPRAEGLLDELTDVERDLDELLGRH